MKKRNIGVWWAANLSRVTRMYEDTPTKRTFVFYGVHIGWWMIGITIAMANGNGKHDATAEGR